MAKRKIKKIEPKPMTEKEKSFRRELLAQMMNLSTSSFGLVAALAWNEVIRTLINDYIKPIVGQDSGVISLIIYALIVTTIAVVVTYNLSKIREKI